MTTKTTVAGTIIKDAMVRATGIAAAEDRAFQIEYQLADLIDRIPSHDGPEGEYRRLLSELADTYQQLALSYKKLSDI